MKPLILSMMLAVILGACNSNHTSDKTSAAHSDLISSYLQIRDALAADNTSKAESAAAEMKSQLIHSALIDKTQAVMMDSALSGIAATADLETQRLYFSELSNQMILLAKNKSFPNQVFYVDSCPMALHNKGGVWLSNEAQITNPYLGTTMPACGTIQDTLSN